MRLKLPELPVKDELTREVQIKQGLKKNRKEAEDGVLVYQILLYLQSYKLKLSAGTITILKKLFLYIKNAKIDSSKVLFAITLSQY